MDFAPSEEHRLLVDALATFVEREMYPHEAEVESLGHVPKELADDIRAKALAAGFYALNMPEEYGGGGLDVVTLTFATRVLGKPCYALSSLCARPAPILRACQGDQIESYLKPTIRGEKAECFALTEPGAGSDARSLATRAVRQGDDWIINGTKQFISHADVADFILLMAATGVDETPRGPRQRITCFLVDTDLPGVEITPLQCVSARGYNPTLINLADVRVPDRLILGAEGKGFDFANDWLYSGRIMMGAGCCGRAERVLGMATEWAATRKQFGQAIGRFQGVSFKLADMATEMEAAWLLVLQAAWAMDQGTVTRTQTSMAKLFASEMLGRATDNAVQIFGGMGLMAELPIERFWRDARVERIWEGTSEVHRHLIARDLLRPHED